jgi:hypothetical protein
MKALNYCSGRKKGQSGMELLMTYGWVAVVGVGAIILLSQMGTFRPASCDKTRVGFSQVNPSDWGVYRDSNVAIIKLENVAGDSLEVTGVNLLLDNITCHFAASAVIQPGVDVFVRLVCSDTPRLSERFNRGDCYRGDLVITYVNKVTGSSDESKGKISGPIEEGNIVTTTSTSSTTSTTALITTTTVDNPPLVELVEPGNCKDTNGNTIHGLPDCP